MITVSSIPGMAIVGFEADQVRKTPEGDVSVPINVAYNHHCKAHTTAASRSLFALTLPPPREQTAPRYWVQAQA
jgi:hypothetical protein